MPRTEPTSESAQLGKRLRELRKGLTMTQEAFAHAVGITDRTVRAYEAGTQAITSGPLQAMARLGIDVLYLLTGSNATSTPPAQQLDLNVRLLNKVCRFVDDPGRTQQRTPMTERERLHLIVRLYLKAMSLGTANFDQLVASEP